MEEKYIPKGSKLLSMGKVIAVTMKDLPMGYVPSPDDLDPVIPKGTVIPEACFQYNGKVIYQHPNFIE